MPRPNLPDDQWKRIAHLRQGKPRDCVRIAADSRVLVGALLRTAHSEAPWRDLPAEFGPWNSLAARNAVEFPPRVLDRSRSSRMGQSWKSDARCALPVMECGNPAGKSAARAGCSTSARLLARTRRLVPPSGDLQAHRPSGMLNVPPAIDATPAHQIVGGAGEQVPPSALCRSIGRILRSPATVSSQPKTASMCLPICSQTRSDIRFN
jgi:hypothetical protein